MTFFGKEPNFEFIFEPPSPGPRKAIFESLLSHFNCFAIPAPVTPSADHRLDVFFVAYS